MLGLSMKLQNKGNKSIQPTQMCVKEQQTVHNKT